MHRATHIIERLARHFTRLLCALGHNIANELRHQYNIFYRPEPLKADGLYHPVEIRVKGHKEMIVRARKGYYAPRE